MIHEDVQKDIDYLKSCGYGWAKYAESVEKQGNPSKKQLDMLKSMVRRVSTFQKRTIETRSWANSFYTDNGSDWCDMEHGDRMGHW